MRSGIGLNGGAAAGRGGPVMRNNAKRRGGMGGSLRGGAASDGNTRGPRAGFPRRGRAQGGRHLGGHLLDARMVNPSSRTRCFTSKTVNGTVPNPPLDISYPITGHLGLDRIRRGRGGAALASVV